MSQYRQGDVLLIKVSALPKTSLMQEPLDENRVVLAYGEVTGHHHSFRPGTNATLFRADEGDGGRYLNVGDKIAELTHQEHETIPVPQGIYKVVQQREFSPKKNHFVSD